MLIELVRVGRELPLPAGDSFLTPNVMTKDGFKYPRPLKEPALKGI